MPKKSGSPVKRQASKKEAKMMTIDYQYQCIDNAPTYSLQIRFGLSTCPHFINSLKCGVMPKFQDTNPYDTAAATVLLDSIKENMVLIKNTQNKLVSVGYLASNASFCVNIALTNSASNVKQAMRVLKKSMTDKLIKRAYGLILARDPAAKGRKDEIQTEVMHCLNRKPTIMLMGRKGDAPGDKKSDAKLL